MNTSEKLTVVAKNQQKVFDAGRVQGERDWWEKYQRWTATSYHNDYMYAFAGYLWDDTAYDPIVQIDATARSNDIFAYSRITDTKVPVNIASSSTTNKNATFRNATNLVTIRKFIVNASQSMNGQFSGCTKLKNLTIEGTIGKAVGLGECPLTRESIESVVNALSTNTSGLTCTFKKTAVESAYTDEQWAAVKNSKPNWAFALA